MSDKLEQKVSEYAKLAKDPNIDVASLMLSAINEKQNVVSGRMKKWAYLVSVGAPPLGLFFAVYFYFFSDKEDAATCGHVCIALTLVAVAFVWIVAKTMLSSSGTSLKQIEQITPQEIQNTLQ